MENLIVKIESKNGLNVVSSRIVAEQLGKEHKNVIRDLENLLSSSNVSQLIIESSYRAKTGIYKEYLLTKDGFTLYMFNIQGYNDFKMAYINRFNEMEKELKEKFKVPTTIKEALLIALEQQEKIELLEIENKIKEQQIAEFEPKIEYLDTILSSEDVMSISQIGADYGLSGKALNKILHEQSLIRSIGRQWILYSEHMNKGYTKSETTEITRDNGTTKIILLTKWTQKGRLKIHEILSTLGIKANQDKEVYQ